jgi:hypothetical protein
MLLDLVPGSISFILPYFIPIDINSYAGPYIRLLSSLTALYSSIIYEKIIRKRSNTIKVTTTNLTNTRTGIKSALSQTPRMGERTTPRSP